MKILLANYKSYPRFSGVASYMARLKGVLESKGHTVDILAHKPGMNEIYLGNSGIMKLPVRQSIEEKLRLNQECQLSDWMRWRELEAYTFEQASRKLNLQSYDCIHTQDIIAARALRRAKPAHVPLVATFHNCKTREWKASGEIQRKTEIEKCYIAAEEHYSAISADKLILPCKWLWQEFEKLGTQILQPAVIPYGIDLASFERKAQEVEKVPAKGDALVIACPARLVAIKGHEFLLQALKKLKKRGSSFICWFIGDGILMEDLKRKTAELDLQDEVLFLGGRSDVPGLLRSSDIVVLPSIHDTLPFTVMEGQLSGKPVVASAVGGITEMIQHGETGLLAEKGNSDSLAYSLGMLLSSEKLRKDLGARAEAWAKKEWSLNRMADRTIGVYQAALLQKRDAKNSKSESEVPDPAFLQKLLSSCRGRSEKAAVPAGFISGKVKNELRQPVKGASVHLIDHSNISLFTVTTDEHGEYVMKNLPLGKYSLTVYKSGCLPVSSSVNVDNAAGVNADFELQQDTVD
ncbi:glycosyltransferase [Bacillus lacus]|uniref:Glycosyltransferase n=1 Tax=Metabacillus lacus TaxID=1983721 RepID=A0A7X2J272_9BACI|nr:glycosyltransferase [Metabacillus lacus]MRX73976.1 glycosyltransferase [Metabacillus lacus]